MSILGGRLWEVVAYKSLDHMGENFSSWEYGNCRDPSTNVEAVFSKSQFPEQIWFFQLLRNFCFLTSKG